MMAHNYAGGGVFMGSHTPRVKQPGGEMPKIDKCELGNVVMTMAKDGLSLNQMVAKLKEEHNFEIGRSTLYRYVKNVKQERAAVSKAVVQGYLQEGLPEDLTILDELVSKLRGWFNGAELTFDTKLKIAEQLRRAIETKLKFSGADEQDDQVIIEFAGVGADQSTVTVTKGRKKDEDELYEDPTGGE